MSKKSTRKTRTTSPMPEMKNPFAFIKPKYYDWLILLFFIVIVYSLFSGNAFLGKSFSSGDSVGGAAAKNFAMEEFKENHRYIFWSPYMFSGMPTYGSIIFNYAYPLMFLQFVLIPDFLINMINLNYIHLIMAGFGLFLLLRHLKLGRIAAIFGGITYMITPHLIGLLTIAHGGKVWTACYIPLVFLVVLRLLEERSFFNLVIAGLVLGLQLLAQHPQIVYYTYMLIGFYFVFTTIWEYVQNKDGKAAASRAVFFVLALIIAFAIAAVYYIPVYQYTQYTMRGSSSAMAAASEVVKGGGLDFDYATKWSFSPKEIITFFAPLFYGVNISSGKVASYWGDMPFTQTTLYMGLFPLLMAILAFVVYRRKKLMIFFLCVWILALLISFGRHFPILTKFMLNVFPFYNKFRVPATIHILIEFSTAVMAGFGINYLLSLKKQEEQDTRRKSSGNTTDGQLSKIVLGFGIFALVLILVFVVGGNGLFKAMSGKMFYREQDVSMIQRSAPQATPQQRAAYLENMKMERFQLAQSEVIRSAFFLLLISALIFLWIKKYIPKHVFSVGIILLLLIDLWIVDTIFTGTAHERIEMKNMLAENESIRFLKEQNKDDLFRILPSPASDMFQDNSWAYHKLQTIGGYSPAKLRHYDDLIQHAMFTNGINMSVLDMLNCKYFVETRLMRLPQNFKLVHDETYKIYENLTALPRAWFVNKLRLAESKKDALEHLNDPTFDPSKYAIMEGEAEFTLGLVDTLGLYSVGTEGQATVSVEEFDYHKIVFKTNSQEDGYLVVSEIWYPPDWKVLIDGKEAKMYKTNFILRGLFIPKGQHTVEFVLDKTIYVLSFWISFSSLILILAVIGITIYKRKKA